MTTQVTHSALSGDLLQKVSPLLQSAGIRSFRHQRTALSLLRTATLYRIEQSQHVSMVTLVAKDLKMPKETVRGHLKIIYAGLSEKYGIVPNQVGVVALLLLFMLTGELPTQE